MMSPTSILYLLAAISFLLGALQVEKANWLCAGLMFLTLSLLIG